MGLTDAVIVSSPTETDIDAAETNSVERGSFCTSTAWMVAAMESSGSSSEHSFISYSMSSGILDKASASLFSLLGLYFTVK